MEYRFIEQKGIMLKQSISKTSLKCKYVCFEQSVFKYSWDKFKQNFSLDITKCIDTLFCSFVWYFDLLNFPFLNVVIKDIIRIDDESANEQMSKKMDKLKI